MEYEIICNVLFIYGEAMKANNRMSKEKMQKKQARVAKKAALRRKIDLVRNIKRNNLSKTSDADQELRYLDTKEFLEAIEETEE